jgi:hypothetical protein
MYYSDNPVISYIHNVIPLVPVIWVPSRDSSLCPYSHDATCYWRCSRVTHRWMTNLLMLGTFAGSSHMLHTVRDQHDTFAMQPGAPCPGRNPLFCQINIYSYIGVWVLYVKLHYRLFPQFILKCLRSRFGMFLILTTNAHRPLIIINVDHYGSNVDHGRGHRADPYRSFMRLIRIVILFKWMYHQASCSYFTGEIETAL